ncbi:hypothetical protein YPPY13_4577, partial [Yersinia pestis PY-13]
MPQQPF